MPSLAGGFFSADGLGPEFLLVMAILTALWGAVKTVPKMLKGAARLGKAIENVEGVPALVKATTDMSTRMVAIEKELKPNGGGSLRDVVNKTAQGVQAAQVTAATAKDAADQVASQLLVSNEQAEVQRQRIAKDIASGRGLISVLLNALSEYAADTHQKEVAYVRALKAFGIDLTDVAAMLEDGPDDSSED